MKPFGQIDSSQKSKVRFVLTDIDDTLTNNGRMTASAFSAIEDLGNNGYCVIPITGRPAGWCDHIARMWPVDAIVGENGAFYFRYSASQRKMHRRYWKTEKQRAQDRIRLQELKEEILQKVPGCGIASDQAYREADLAIDYCEDVSPLPKEKIEQIVDCFASRGAQARISSIHINGWFGDYNKLEMTKLMFEEQFHVTIDEARDQVIFVGDSPNDAPMFEYFPQSVGVSNVRSFLDLMDWEPTWVTDKPGGYGFAEMVEHLIS